MTYRDNVPADPAPAPPARRRPSRWTRLAEDIVDLWPIAALVGGFAALLLAFGWVCDHVLPCKAFVSQDGVCHHVQHVPQNLAGVVFCTCPKEPAR